MTYEEKINGWASTGRPCAEQLLEGELEMMRSAAQRVTAWKSGMPGSGRDVDRLPPGGGKNRRNAEKTGTADRIM